MKKSHDWIGVISAVGEVISSMLKNPRVTNPHFNEQKKLELGFFSSENSTQSLAIYPSYDEYWDRFPSIAVEIVQALFADLDVLTVVHAFPSHSKIKRRYDKKYNIYSSEQMFLRTYFETLRLRGLAESVYYREPEELISRTKGADIPLSTMLFSGDYGVLTYEAYGYASLPAMETFQQAKEQIRNVPPVVYLDYGRAPDEIDLMVDTEKLPLADCISRIKDACQTLDIPLEIDSKLSQYIQ